MSTQSADETKKTFKGPRACCEWSLSTTTRVVYCPQCFDPLSKSNHVHMPIQYDSFHHVQPWTFDTTYACCSYECLLGFALIKYHTNAVMYTNLLFQYLIQGDPKQPVPIPYPPLELQSRYTHALPDSLVDDGIKLDKAKIETSMKRRTQWILQSKMHYDPKHNASQSQPSLSSGSTSSSSSHARSFVSNPLTLDSSMSVSSS